MNVLIPYCNQMLYCTSFDTLGGGVGLCIISRYIGCIDTLTIRYISYHLFQLHDTLNDTFVLKFRIFYSLKFPNSHEICGNINFFWAKIRQNVSLIHIEYRFMCIIICIVLLKLNDTEPY